MIDPNEELTLNIILLAQPSSVNVWKILVLKFICYVVAHFCGDCAFHCQYYLNNNIPLYFMVQLQICRAHRFLRQYLTNSAARLEILRAAENCGPYRFVPFVHLCLIYNSESSKQKNEHYGVPFELSKAVFTFLISYWTRLQHRQRSQQAEMLLDQSVMWLRKATDWWCDSGGLISI